MNIFLSSLACVRFWELFSCTPHRVMSSPQRRAGSWLIYPRSSPSPVSLLMQTIQCQELRRYMGPNHDGRPCVWALDTDQLQPPTSHPPPQLPRLALGREGNSPTALRRLGNPPSEHFVGLPQLAMTVRWAREVALQATTGDRPATKSMGQTQIFAGLCFASMAIPSCSRPSATPLALPQYIWATGRLLLRLTWRHVHRVMGEERRDREAAQQQIEFSKLAQIKTLSAS